jgi:hypothetical protein
MGFSYGEQQRASVQKYSMTSWPLVRRLAIKNDSSAILRSEPRSSKKMETKRQLTSRSPSKMVDFESSASGNSATPALLKRTGRYGLGAEVQVG